MIFLLAFLWLRLVAAFKLDLMAALLRDSSVAVEAENSFLSTSNSCSSTKREIAWLTEIGEISSLSL